MKNTRYIYIGGIIIFIITCIISAIYITNEESFANNSSNIIFLNKTETRDFIYKDSDNYIKSLSIYDLFARKVINTSEYMENVIKSCLDFSEIQKEKIRRCAKIAKSFFDNGYIWKFSLIDKDYEEGFPHTRKDIIFLSPKVIDNNDDELIKILIHESIHIYQRYNKNIIKYLRENNYTVSRRRDTEPLIRANPDLDEYIYMDEYGKEMIYKYKSTRPTGINDIIPNKNEHPFEKMAYEISEDYGKFKISKYKYI